MSTLRGTESPMTMVGRRVAQQPPDHRGSDGQHEDEDHSHCEQETKASLLKQGIDLLLDLWPLVRNDDDLDSGGQSRGVQRLSHCLGHFDGVGLRLLDDGDVDGLSSVGAGDAGGHLVRGGNTGHIGQQDWTGGRRPHYEVPNVCDRAEQVDGLHWHRLTSAEEQARREGDVVFAQRCGDLGQ